MASLMLVNPKKRRKSKARRKSSSRSKTRTVVKYRSRKRSVKRRRRNPIRSKALMNTATNALKDGAAGSLGAIAGTLAASYLPIPEQYKTGPMGAVIQALIGIGVGVAVGKVAKNKKLGADMARGSVAVALHDTFKGLISQAVPQLNLKGFDDDGLLGMDEYVMNEYVGPSAGVLNGMGYAGAGTSAGNRTDYDTNDLL